MLTPVRSPIRLAVSTQSTKPQALPAENNRKAQSVKTEEVSGSNLEHELEELKALSLEYQLMLAIARQNGAEDKPSGVAAKRTGILSESSYAHLSTSIISSQNLQVESFQEQFSLTIETISSTTIEVNSVVGDSVFSLSFTQQSAFSVSVSIADEEPQRADPLILNLGNSDFGFDPEQQVSFDLNADGFVDSFHNLKNGSVFLAFDRNGNGSIDDGSELFGDAGGAVDGFANLALFDDNRDNRIDSNDRIFENLLLLSFGSEVDQQTTSLASQNIESLLLNYETRQKTYFEDNILVSEADFERTDGTTGRIGDFLLGIT